MKKQQFWAGMVTLAWPALPSRIIHSGASRAATAQLDSR